MEGKETMSTESCSTQAQCSTPQVQEECCDMPEKLLALADAAWAELVKEKIKKEIEASCGEKLNKLAKLVAETNKAKWSAKIAAKQGCNEYREGLFKFFTQD
jgi:hypothetical protein